MKNNLKPLGSSLEEFLISPNQLPPAEQKLLDSCRNGTIARISTIRPKVATPDNTVRAEFIRLLALQTDDRAPIHTKGIQLVGAYLSGILDLSNCAASIPISIEYSHFENPVNLEKVSLHSLNLFGCLIPALMGDGLQCSHNVTLQKISAREIRLLGAKIGGQLSCSGATLDNPDGKELSADRAEINGDVFLDEKFSAKGEIRLLGAKIGGQLSCSGATLDNPDSKALSADLAEINGAVFLSDGCFAKGEVRLLGAKIGSHLACSGATLVNHGRIALNADRVNINGGVFLCDGFSANGTISLLGAKIGGNFDCNKANLQNTYFGELIAQNMEVKGVLFFTNVVHKNFSINLSNSKVDTIVDDANSWPQGLNLHGFTYQRFAGDAAVDAESRINWLKKQKSEFLSNVNYTPPTLGAIGVNTSKGRSHFGSTFCRDRNTISTTARRSIR